MPGRSPPLGPRPPATGRSGVPVRLPSAGAPPGGALLLALTAGAGSEPGGGTPAARASAPRTNATPTEPLTRVAAVALTGAVACTDSVARAAPTVMTVAARPPSIIGAPAFCWCPDPAEPDRDRLDGRQARAALREMLSSRRVMIPTHSVISTCEIPAFGARGSSGTQLCEGFVIRRSRQWHHRRHSALSRRWASALGGVLHNDGRDDVAVGLSHDSDIGIGCTDRGRLRA